MAVHGSAFSVGTSLQIPTSVVFRSANESLPRSVSQFRPFRSCVRFSRSFSRLGRTTSSVLGSTKTFHFPKFSPLSGCFRIYGSQMLNFASFEVGFEASVLSVRTLHSFGLRFSRSPGIPSRFSGGLRASVPPQKRGLRKESSFSFRGGPSYSTAAHSLTNSSARRVSASSVFFSPARIVSSIFLTFFSGR